MNFKNQKVGIVMFFLASIVLVLAYRIYDNIREEKGRALKISQKGAVSVEIGRPERRTVYGKIKFSGRLEPGWRADIAAKVDGRIEKIHVREGERVTKGQLLADLERMDTDAGVIGARGGYLDAQTNYRRAVTELERYEKLHAQGAVSLQQLENYRFARDNAAAKLESARGNLQAMEAKADGAALVAPADGIVARRHYQEGYYAKAGTVLFTVADISRLKTVINIPEGQIAHISVDSEARIQVPSLPGKEITGRVTSISPVADLPSHTFFSEISVDNTYGLRGGITADVFIDLQPRHNVLTIPAGAILMRSDQKTVFTADSEGTVRRVVLDVGYMDGEIAEIRGGLSEHDIIVVGGQNKLREGNKVKLDKAE